MGNEQGKPEFSGFSASSEDDYFNSRQKSSLGNQYITEQQLRELYRERITPLLDSVQTMQQEMKKLSTKMDGFTAAVDSLKSASATVETAEAKARQVARNNTKSKLPKFAGNPEEWHYFRASFETTTAACGFSDEENLIRLQDSLEGSALESVRGLLMHPKLVPKVIETLEKNYGNPELLLLWHTKKIKALENPDPEKMSTCVAFAKALEQLCDLLEASGMKDYQNDVSLVNEFSNKLPGSQNREWCECAALNDRRPTVRTFCNFVQEKLDQARKAYPDKYKAVLEATLPYSQPKAEKTKSKQPSQLSQSSKNVETRSTNQAKEAASTAAKPKVKCNMCNRYGHPLWLCREFIQLDVKTRKVLVEVWKVCAICLCDHPKEGKEQCAHRIRCNVGRCREKHNALLHEGKEEVPNADSDNDDTEYRLL